MKKIFSVLLFCCCAFAPNNERESSDAASSREPADSNDSHRAYVFVGGELMSLQEHNMRTAERAIGLVVTERNGVYLVDAMGQRYLQQSQDVMLLSAVFGDLGIRQSYIDAANQRRAELVRMMQERERYMNAQKDCENQMRERHIECRKEMEGAVRNMRLSPDYSREKHIELCEFLKKQEIVSRQLLDVAHKHKKNQEESVVMLEKLAKEIAKLDRETQSRLVRV